MLTAMLCGCGSGSVIGAKLTTAATRTAAWQHAEMVQSHRTG
jgi:hypothetical protein